MYKFISIVLLVGLCALAILFGVEKCNNSKLSKELNNAKVELEGVQQETATALSIRAKLEEDLKAENQELQQKIADRDERILAQTKLTVQLQDKILKMKNATQTTVDQVGNVVVVTEENKCDQSLRQRVEFDAEEKPLKITGFTLTNPAYAEVQVKWLYPLNLELNLTRDAQGNFRVYADSSDLRIGDIQLNIDPEVLETRWYQNISFGSDLAAGEYGGLFTLRPGYDITKNWNINVMFIVLYDGKQAKTFYGAGVAYYPWK